HNKKRHHQYADDRYFVGSGHGLKVLRAPEVAGKPRIRYRASGMDLKHIGEFPSIRMRRLRQSPALRRLVAETRLSADQLVLPLFSRPGRNVRNPVDSMPGVFQLSSDEVVREVERAAKAGIRAVLLFGIPATKDAKASGAYASDGIVQTTVRAVKKAVPD